MVIAQDPAIREILAQLVKKSSQRILKIESKVTEVALQKSALDNRNTTIDCGIGDRNVEMKTGFCQATKKMTSSSTQTSSRKQRWRQKKPKFCPRIIINLSKDELQEPLPPAEKVISQKKQPQFIAKQAIKDVVK
jgi:hypothetical protein